VRLRFVEIAGEIVEGVAWLAVEHGDERRAGEKMPDLAVVDLAQPARMRIVSTRKPLAQGSERTSDIVGGRSRHQSSLLRERDDLVDLATILETERCRGTS
jgi:hypothetical protein